MMIVVVSNERNYIIIMKSKTLIVNFFLLTIILYLPSCATTTVVIPKEIDITSTGPSNKIPLKAALYLNQGLRNATYTMHTDKIFFGVASAGDALCNNSEKIVRNIFQEIIMRDGIEKTSDSSSKNYD